MREALRKDEGFTLTELVVVIILLGFVLGVGWTMFDLAARGADQATGDAWLSREIGQPLEYAEKIYMQQLDIRFHDSANIVQDPRWWCRATTDRDHDDLLEQYIFQVTTDGRLLVTSSETSDSPTPRTATWSTHNVNRRVSPPIPLFRYFNASGVEISGQPVDHIQQYAASMLITIAAERDGETVIDSRRVYFRNQ
ncbi:MAG: PulJ/GspJ family protein [Coriobacteriia bacterium]